MEGESAMRVGGRVSGELRPSPTEKGVATG